MPTIPVKDANGTTVVVQSLPAVGANTSANALPVTLASDQAGLPLPTGASTEATALAGNVLSGAVTEAAPATDTASSGLNGRLQRIAQRITSLIAQIPATLGIKTAANSLSIAPASDAQFVVGDGTNAVAVGTSGADAVANTVNRLRTQCAGTVFNGTTWDRSRGGVTADTGAATGYHNVLHATGAVTGATVVSSTAYEASRVIKASAGTLLALRVYSNRNNAQFIQIHNTTSVPADTAVPIATFIIESKTNLAVDIQIVGLPLSTGITVCNSSTGPTKTINAADCFFTAIIK